MAIGKNAVRGLAGDAVRGVVKNVLRDALRDTFGRSFWEFSGKVSFTGDSLPRRIKYFTIGIPAAIVRASSTILSK